MTTSTPTNTPTDQPHDIHDHSSENKMLTAVLIVLLLFILGTLYIWFSSLTLQQHTTPAATPVAATDSRPAVPTTDLSTTTREELSTSSPAELERY